MNNNKMLVILTVNIGLIILNIIYVYQNADTNARVQHIPVRKPAIRHIESISVSEVPKIKVIKRLSGFSKRNKTHQHDVQCGQYKCLIKDGERDPSGADLVFFNGHDIKKCLSPPKKGPNQLWGFVSFEPQDLVETAPVEEWNGMFNYSATYVRESNNTIYSTRRDFTKKENNSVINFAAKQPQRQLRALWFVSHCDQPGRHGVMSGRGEYVLELSKYLPIDVFTKDANYCAKQFGDLVKKENKTTKMKNYLFYLSFENNLCRDYITEKLWKVIEADGPTIPITLGGLSIEEYEYVAPPNSFIHVRNFTSPAALAAHLKLVATDDAAFNYYHQWRNEYYLVPKKKQRWYGEWLCYFCRMAYEKEPGIWKTFGKDFNKDNCLNVSFNNSDYCTYYNLTCNNSITLQ